MADNNNKNGVSDNQEAFTISIWLLPASPDREHLSSMITKFSQEPGDEAAAGSCSVPFQPHVTLVGGIPCASMDQFQTNLLPSLLDGIQKEEFCRMNCQFSSTDPVYHNKWNQACVLVVKETPQFEQLVGLCREIVLKDSSNSKDGWYPPPLCKPHLSLYYGDPDGAPSATDVTEGLTAIMSGSNDHSGFEASQIAIWKTDPATVEGVAQWEELAVIDLSARTT